MPVTADKPAPYATTPSILEIIERHRNKGLSTPVNAEVLARCGIADSLVPRTLQALVTLDLITEDGQLTETIEGLRLAPESEYQQRLAEWLNSAYEDALAYVDPATSTDSEIRDAFRTYKPIGQQSRMVTLFQGLYAAAGIGSERPRSAPRKSSPKKGSDGGQAVPPKTKKRAPAPTPTPSPTPAPTPKRTDKPLEYQLVDLLTKASGDQDVMDAIIKVVTFLKTQPEDKGG